MFVLLSIVMHQEKKEVIEPEEKMELFLSILICIELEELVDTQTKE
jgi:hypothetical protein